MNYEVPNLYDNLNLSTLPDIIKEEFYMLGSYWQTKNEPIFLKPYDNTYTFNLDNEKLKFYTHSKASKHIDNLIRLKSLLNKDYELIDYNTYSRHYIKEYGKGFFNGYNNYTKELQNKENSIFEPNNKQIAFKIFSKVIERKDLRTVESFPINLISFDDEKKINKKFNSDRDLYLLKKESFYSTGFKSGEKYKAWATILHNPTLFEELFKEQLQIPEEKEEVNTIEINTLNLKNIPKFNLQQRYKIFTQLGYDKAIHTLDTSKSSKNKILALIMGISVDNAKHLLNNTYKEFKPEDIEEFDEYLERIKVKL